MEYIWKILLTTYTICLPLLIKIITDMMNQKKEAHIFIEQSMEKLEESFKNLENSVDNIKNKMAFDDAMTSRYRLIRAADEIRNDIELSDDHLEQLGEDIEIYTGYCSSNPNYKNHKGQNSMRIVLAYEDKRIKESANNE